MASSPEPAKGISRETVAVAVSAISLVASVIAIGVTVYQSGQTAEREREIASMQDQASRYGDLMQANLDLDRVLFENPTLSRCFRAGACPAELTDSEKRQAKDLGYLILDTYQFIHDQVGTLERRPASGEFVLRGSPLQASYPGWVTWSHAIGDGFTYGPLLCRLLDESADSYEATFVSAVDSAGWCDLRIEQ